MDYSIDFRGNGFTMLVKDDAYSVLQFEAAKVADYDQGLVPMPIASRVRWFSEPADDVRERQSA